MEEPGYRTEHDLLGERRIIADAYWGIYTLRAVENFPLTGCRISPLLIKSLAMVKKACCLANEELGFLEPKKARAIRRACDDVCSGALDEQFPVDALQGGAGTSTNMNANEVIANRALELLGKWKGDYRSVHPLEHVNLHQSTNDVYPTAVKIAAIYALRGLSAAIALLQGAFQDKERGFSSIITIGRTELQEAVPITLGSQFSSFAEAFARDRWRTYKCEERLRVVNLGGTAVGTGLTAPRSYIFLVCDKLREVTGLGLARAENMMDQTANADCFVEVSGILNAHAANLRKVSNDLRLLHLLGEISLPPLQAGSSIMPGKVNPVMLEAAVSASVKVNANTAIVSEVASMGSLQLNEFLPLLSFSLLESLQLLTALDKKLAEHVGGIVANEAVCLARIGASTTLAAAFVPNIGYEKAQALILEYNLSGRNDFRSFLVERLGSSLVDQVLTAANLLSLGYRDTPGAPSETQ